MPNLANYLPSLVLLAAVGSGLMAGLFFAFSTFVMQALSKLPPEQGMAAMQQINTSVTTALFGIAFFGTALVCIVIVLGTLQVARPSVAEGLFLAGSVLYLAAVIGVTVTFNVPLNNSLAATDATQAADYWPRYVDSWLRWNHVRTVGATLSVACFAWGLFKMGVQRTGQ